MGAFRPFSNEQIHFLELIKERVAMSTEAASIRSQRSKLLEILEEKARELERRENDFRRSDELFRWVFDYSDHLLIMIDNGGMIKDINERAMAVSLVRNPVGESVYRAFAWKENEDYKDMLKRCISMCLSGEEVQGVFSIALTHEKTSRFEFMFKQAQGETAGYFHVLMDGKELC